jgi:LacI family transcriptional regulator
MPTPGNRITITDIANRVGVSTMTVSRALRGSPEVSSGTRQRVLRCAEELGYRPNRWARTLVTRKTSIVGVVVPDISHSFFAEVTRGIQEVLSRAGYNVLLCDSCLDPEKERAEIEMLIASMVDGLIVASEQSEKAPQLFRSLMQKGIRFVLVDRFFPRWSFPAVVTDDLAVGRLATEHLINLGHTRIAHIQGPGLSPASLRLRGYCETLEAQELPVNRDWIRVGNFDIASGREAMRALLRSTPRPTAVFAANDPMAIGAICACREAGLSVPAQVSVVGAGNIEGVHHPNPFLTTVDWPRQELGRCAATLLLGMTEKTAGSPADLMRTFPPRLLERQSAARRGKTADPVE